MSQTLGLQDHMNLLGLSPRTLSLRLPDVPQAAVERALQGLPISHATAVKICNELSKQHKLDSKRGVLTPGDLGIATWKHSAMEDSTMQRMNGADILRSMEPCDQVRLAARIFEIQERDRATRATLERALRQPEIQRLVRQVIERNKRQPAYASSSGGMITRSVYDREAQARAFIAQHRGDLARSNREIAELRRQVQRERAGYR